MSEVTGSNTAACGQPLASHILGLIGVMVMAGLGGGCVDTYRALMEVAEHLRNHENFPPYVATGLPVVEAITVAKAQAATAEAAEQLSRTPLTGRPN